MWKCWFLRKNVILREKPLGSEKRTNNKLNPQVESPSAVELGPHELKASALNKAPSLVLGLQKNIHLICFCHLSSWGWNNGRGWLLRFLNKNIPYKLVPHKFSAVSVFQCTFCGIRTRIRQTMYLYIEIYQHTSIWKTFHFNLLKIRKAYTKDIFHFCNEIVNKGEGFGETEISISRQKGFVYSNLHVKGLSNEHF